MSNFGKIFGYRLEAGEIVELAINIFAFEGEQFYKMFAVYTGLNVGTPALRYLVVTNCAIHLVRKRNLDVAAALNAYSTETTVAFGAIDYISVRFFFFWSNFWAIF